MTRTTVRRVWLVVLATLLAPLAGCQIPNEKVERNAKSMEPLVLATAEERAKSDLSCGAVTAEIVARDIPKEQTAYSLQRTVYTVETQGCKRKTRYSVACVPGGPCSAMSESGLIEKTQ